MGQPMQFNKNPISLREGKAFIDGVEVIDNIALTFTFTPDVWTGRQMGERSPSSRWVGYEIAGSISRRRNTPWLREKIKEYLADGHTPEIKIQGVMTDDNSDYYAQYGSDTVTLVGVVLTGGLQLLAQNSDSSGVLEDSIAFNAKDMV